MDQEIYTDNAEYKRRPSALDIKALYLKWKKLFPDHRICSHSQNVVLANHAANGNKPCLAFEVYITIIHEPK